MSSNPYPYGPYSSTTPRPNSSSHTVDKYASPNSLSHQGKLQSWADSKIPTTKKSPVKSSVKSPKSHIDSQLKDLLAAEKERAAVSRGGLKKSQYSTKENTQKSSNSPAKNGLESKKRSMDSNNHPILINNYELNNIDAQRLNQLQTLALQQEFLSQPVKNAEFVEWVAKKALSTKNADRLLRNSEQFQQFYNQTEERQRQNSTSDLHNNVWPQQPKGEIYSHRQHLEAEGVKKTGKKQLTLSPNKKDSFSNQPRGVPPQVQKSISKNKPGTPKGAASLKVSPRNIDLSSHYHHIIATGSAKLSNNDSHLLKNSFNLDSIRASFDAQGSRQNSAQHNKRFEFPKTTKNESKPKTFFQEESPVKLKKKKLIKSPTKKKSSVASQDLEITEWLRTAKKSNPNVLNDINSYMQLVRMQPEIHDYAYAQPEKEQYALSTRSVGGANIQHPTEEDDGQGGQQYMVRSSVKTIYSSLKSHNKEENHQEGSRSRYDQSPKTDEIVNELLKRTNSKDLIINPNAKFMALRKQIHEKRTKATFKSADWGLPGAQNNDLQRDFTDEQDCRPEVDVSPERATKARNASGNTKSMEGAPVKAQLDHILNKTKQILGTYRYRENHWDKEKKALVNEILHLRSVIEHN